GRTWDDIGKKMAALHPLAGQVVDPTDSVLGIWSNFPNPGIHDPATGAALTYADLVRRSFRRNLWSSLDDFGGFTQLEKNFSLFFGLSVELYESMLVSDNSPFDIFQDGGGATGTNANALTAQQQEGLDIFLNRGNCINCHAGAEFAGATVQQVMAQGPIQR